jgi:biopolymer transport protein ExbB/TolQ
METLTHSLYIISNLLLGPVVVVLLVMLAWTVCLLGGFLRECFERKTVRKSLRAMLAALHRGDGPGAFWRELAAARAGLPMRFFRLLNRTPTTDEHILNRALSELEHDITESMAKHSFIVRVGPMLGLMGTLIPLGPALTGLAGGNMQAMASNLVVAFTTTVVGLFISGLAYGMTMARRTWYGRDFNDLELLCEKLAASNGAEHAP